MYRINLPWNGGREGDFEDRLLVEISENNINKLMELSSSFRINEAKHQN